MRIGIVGSGNIGAPLGRLWAAAGHDVLFSSRNPGALADLVRRAGRGARAGTPDEAMAFGDVVLEAVPFAAALQLPAPALAGKLLISASNYYPARDGQLALGGRSQSEALAARLPGARVVKAFNMMYAEEMRRRADGETDERLAIFVAGDDAEARGVAAGLVADARFAPVDAGALREGALFESGGPLYARPMRADTAEQALAAARGGASAGGASAGGAAS